MPFWAIQVKRSERMTARWSEEMDLDQVTAAVEGTKQLQADGPADISQLLEESQQCAQFSEDLRTKLLLGNMVRAPSATVVYYPRV